MSQAAISPWQWQPEWAPWFARLVEQAALWEPSPCLTADRAAVAQAVAKAAEQHASWLYHPCISGITHSRADGQQERDAALAAWLAHHTGLDGELVLAAPLWCWSTTGGVLLEPGSHRLDSVAASLGAGEPTPYISFDPWCMILGYTHPDSWPASEQSPEHLEAGVKRGAMVALRAQALVRSVLPGVSNWLDSLAKLLIFLNGTDNLTRSSSAADLPGIIFADTTSEIALLEVMVHESAHHLLYIAETGGPLIDPAETRTFVSPLRPDPRPLRGILLAYHALAFMCAFYRDLRASDLGDGVMSTADLLDLQRKMSEAGGVLDAASSSLTDRGIEFLKRTHEVARYAV
ncbi:MAG: aKG-HExxH-type peptide beta-hydroxylase [Actinomycetota bacterium]